MRTARGIPIVRYGARRTDRRDRRVALGVVRSESSQIAKQSPATCAVSTQSGDAVGAVVILAGLGEQVRGEGLLVMAR
jgi:hypothetical protein